MSAIEYSMRILTPEEFRALGTYDSEEDQRETRREARNAWKLCGDYKRLALQLGVKKVLAETSERQEQGEYIEGLPDHWTMSEERRFSFSSRRNSPAILIDIENAISLDGIPEVISHEIGHHIDNLANSDTKRIPSQSFVSSFKRAGFREYTDWQSDLFSELIAETFGQYLRGHKLNSVLLAEVNKVLVKLTPKQRRIIQAFRNKQSKQNEGRS
jgi:hypothetical protein